MGGGGGGRLFEAGRLLTFSAFRMGAYSRWALIRGWALIRINTVPGQRIAKIDELMLAAWSLVPFTKIHSWNWLLHDVILYTSLGKATDS